MKKLLSTLRLTMVGRTHHVTRSSTRTPPTQNFPLRYSTQYARQYG